MQLDDDYSCFSIEPRSPINICEEIDNNSATREPTLIKIYSELLDANLIGFGFLVFMPDWGATWKVVVKRG
jgi:hypothetical protein